VADHIGNTGLRISASCFSIYSTVLRAPERKIEGRLSPHIVKRQGDSTTTPLGLRITKQGGGGVMIKIKLRTAKGVPYGLGVSMFTGEECSWGLYHLEAISTQSTGSHICLALTNVSE
jgi:hypothetical protein